MNKVSTFDLMILKKPDGLFGELYMNWYMLYSFFDGIVDVGFDEDSADADVIAAVDECWMLVWSAWKVMSRTTLICYSCLSWSYFGKSSRVCCPKIYKRGSRFLFYKIPIKNHTQDLIPKHSRSCMIVASFVGCLEKTYRNKQTNH